MAQTNFLVDLNLNDNQLTNATIQNLGIPPSTTGKKAGFIYWNTADKTAYIFTGRTGVDSPSNIVWLNLGSLYTHPTIVALNPNLSGANVLASLTVNLEGHVTAATTRAMTLADLGYSGSPNANDYTHPTFTGNTLAGAPLTGALVISNVVVNAQGHVESFSTRSLTPGDIGASSSSHSHTINDITDINASAAELNLLDLAGLTAGWVLRATGATTAAWGKLLGSQITNDLNWVSINDLVTNTTQTWSSTKIQTMLNAINSSFAGGLINKGSYDASTNTPKLSTTPIADIKNGWTYVVTVAGNFFTEAVQVGDMIIASQNDPTTLAHWTTVNKNIPDILDATTTIKGIVQLATPVEVQTGTDNTKAITPLGLSSRTATTVRTGIVELATDAETLAGTDTERALTPANLKAALVALALDGIGTYTQTFGNASLTSFDITHSLGTLTPIVEIFTNTTGETVYMQVKRQTLNMINIQCNVAPATNEYRIVVKK